MKRHMVATVFVLLGASFHEAGGQLGLFSKRETFTVPVAHPPELVLPNVKRIAIAGFAGLPCGQELRDRLSETVTRSGTFELIDRTSLGVFSSSPANNSGQRTQTCQKPVYYPIKRRGLRVRFHP